MEKKIFVGTSGWHYAHWKGRFYPADLRDSDRLSYYTSNFSIVELNNTFYRLPTETAVIQWRESSPPDFRFAIKGSRFITHMKKLKDPAVALERFFSRVDLLKPKTGPVLLQLPPKWSVDEARLNCFLEALPSGYRYAFEFRDPSWNTAAVFKLLWKYQAAHCIFDLAGFQSPLSITTDFTYIRLHGPGGRYQGSYDNGSLQTWAQRLREWNLDASYVFFDNDQAAFAVENAKTLQAMLRG